MKLLHLDSSILGQYSVSRKLSADLVAHQRTLHTGLEVTYHDQDADPQPHLSSAHMAAMQGLPVDDPAIGADLAAGAAAIDEVFAHDILVIGAPMYNFSVSTQLKAWIDRISVAGKTFRYAAAGPEGLVLGKKAFIVSTRGGIYTPGAPAAAAEHHETYLLTVLSLIGITDVTVIRAEGLALGPDAKEAAIKAAQTQILALAA